MSVCQWQVLQVLDILSHHIHHLLNGSIQTTCESTLWIGDRGATWLQAVQVWETEHEITLSAKVPNLVPDSLEVEVTPETVLIQGKSRKPLDQQNYFDLEFCTNLFQSLIPLPVPVQTHAVLAELQDNHLMLTLQKAWRSRRFVKVKVLDSEPAVVAQPWTQSLPDPCLIFEDRVR